MCIRDRLEVVDITPDDLLQRIRAQQLLSPAELAIAMQRELRPAVLDLLRETALRLTADHTDRHLRQYLPLGPHEFRGHVTLCISARPGLLERIRSAARYAAVQDARFTLVTVKTRELSAAEKSCLGAYATEVDQLGGTLERIESRNVAAALAAYIKDEQVTEVILGHRRSATWWTARWFRAPWDTTSELIRRLSGVDVHILRSAQAEGGPSR